MYYLASGDINNSAERSFLEKDYVASDYLLSAIYNNELNYNLALEEIFTRDEFDRETYRYYTYLLTIGDLVPAEYQIDHITATAYFFVLLVHICNSQHKSDKRIPSPYLAIKTAQAFNWNYAEYIDSDSTVADQMSPENFTFSMKFSYILNEFTFTIPVVKVKKGFIIKKDVGYMLNPSFNSYVIYTIGNDKEKHRMPKSYLLELMSKEINAKNSLIFHDYTDILLSIDRSGSSSTVLDILYINGFFGICSFDTGENQFWVDENDDMLYVEGKNAPVYTESRDEDTRLPAGWQKIREHLYRAFMYNQKLYISYMYKNNIVLLSH